MDIVAERLQAATASLTLPFVGGAFESPDWWEPPLWRLFTTQDVDKKE